MGHREIFDFSSFHGEHPYIGILLVPWNYSPCILVAASWCLTHTTPITRQYFVNISVQNPYKVIAGLISTSYYQDANKNQMGLGIKAVFHPNPLVAFVLIKVIPEFRLTLFVDHRQLMYNANESVNENCESTYWFMNKREVNKKDFFYEYLLMNQIPCPYKHCHYSNTTPCSIFKKPKINDVSATILCNNHLMGFAEFGYENGRSVHYHRITDDVITWMKQCLIIQ